MAQSQGIQPVKPYSALASIYDHVMSHVDYEMWARYMERLFSLARRPVSCIVDLSCGTGNLLFHLRKNYAHLLGLDLSWPMLHRAKQKYPELPFICSDFTNLPLTSQTVDVALSLYDSVNYLMTDSEVLQFLDESFRVLRRGGVLIFDVVTPYLCKTAFKSYRESAQINDHLHYDRYSFFNDDQQTQINQFHIWLNGAHYYEEHQQRIREIKKWIKLISQSNFKIQEIFSNFSMKPVQETAERAHFVLMREG